MDFKQYLETYNAQNKIDKLVKKYKNRKIVLYGAGKFAETIFQNYNLSKLNITAVCDKRFEDKNNKMFYNMKCITPKELGDIECDLILIANFDCYKFVNIIDNVLYGTKNESVEIRPLIKLDFWDYVKIPKK